MIEMGKKYRTRDGRKVRILCADMKSESGFCVVGVVTNSSGTEFAESWTAHGEAYSCQASAKDLIKIGPYEDWPIDAPIWIRKRLDASWYPRHYAGVAEDGRPLIFSEGRTSFNAYDVFACEEARLASEFTPAAEERGE